MRRRSLALVLALALVAAPVLAALQVHNHTFGASANGSTTGETLRPGVWLAIITGTFDSATVDLEYSRDGGANWVDVHVAGLVGITTAMASPLEIRVTKSTLFRWTAAGGGASMDVDCWMAYGGG